MRTFASVREAAAFALVKLRPNGIRSPTAARVQSSHHDGHEDSTIRALMRQCGCVTDEHWAIARMWATRTHHAPDGWMTPARDAWLRRFVARLRTALQREGMTPTRVHLRDLGTWTTWTGTRDGVPVTLRTLVRPMR